MARPRALVLRAPGTNCDRETEYAFELAGADADRIHVNALVAQPRLLDDYQIFCVPGGFSYGDDVSAGRILASELNAALVEGLHKFRGDGKLVIGICNGFQTLLKAGLLVGAEQGTTPATLTWNDTGRYQDRWVRLAVTSDRCEFLRGIDELLLPVAHAEGKFVVRDEATLGRLDRGGQLTLRYAPRLAGGAFPDNPNGSQDNVAGVCDETGRVFGLMPHPERFVTPTQHPRWTRWDDPTAGPVDADGLRIFRSAVEFFA
jgi:phosphoribosylformylglycinamidine synthase